MTATLCWFPVLRMKPRASHFSDKCSPELYLWAPSSANVCGMALRELTYLLCVCVCVEVREQLSGISSLLLPCRSGRWDSGGQVWWKAPFLAKPYHRSQPFYSSVNSAEKTHTHLCTHTGPLLHAQNAPRTAALSMPLVEGAAAVHLAKRT